MKTHVEIKRVEKFTIRALALMLLMLLVAPVVPAQAPPNPIPPRENILSGALIIPMDNFHQGDNSLSTFNLRAYGLANLFLQNDIPVKWAIKPGKSKDDLDFSANVTRIAGTAGVAGPADASFAGGPFIVTQEYNTPFVQNLISTFNGAGTPVTVYRTNDNALVDIRYTLTHKPRIAVGPDGGDFGGQVFEGLFDRAGIPNYVLGVDDIDSAGACFSMATQGHQEDPSFVGTYRQFVQGGGNLILQCASIPTFENHPLGHFQTTGSGYTVFTSNAPSTEVNSNAFAFPEGSMPFNQFLGLLADQDGEVTEYAYAPGAGPANGNRISATNTGADAGKFVATVSQLNGPNAIGGVVFEMSGHNYARLDSTETDTPLAMLNGQRMQLNTVFVPAGTICTQPQQAVTGFKSVRKTADGSPDHAVPLWKGDTVEWTIDYINNSQVHQFQFQIQDIINEFNQHLIFVPGSVSVTAYSGATAAVNPAFTGAGAGNTLDLLAAGATLPVGGRIRVRLSTVIANSAPNPYDLFNQTTARSLTLVPTPTTKSDAIDANNAGIFSEDPPPADSIPQIQNGAIINPTKIRIEFTTAANVSVDGRVVDQNGAAIRNALVSVRNALTGAVTSMRTNSFGFFHIGDLEAGGLYTISVRHKRFRFGDPIVVTLGEDMTGLTITGIVGNANNPRQVVIAKSRAAL